MHYYQHHIGDYRRDTAHLSLMEHGVYRQLLDWAYLDNAPIPKETETVYRRLSAKTEEEKNAIDIVLNEFFTFDIGYTQKRVELEKQAYERKAATARIAGKLGGRPKKTEEVIFGLTEKTDGKANHKPLTTNQEPITNKPKEEKERAKALVRPDDVELQVWEDWVQLRKAKKAPVTETVLKTARKEAGIAGMTLMAFLEVWCARGSQGLVAAWLKDAEKPIRFARADPSVTVPSNPRLDPEIIKAENDLKNRAPMPQYLREMMQKNKIGVPA
jgi:uncharacterized protein YdaU (DUF1376 family)